MDRQILRYLQSHLSLNQLKQIHSLITVNCISLTSIFTRKLLSLSFTDYARKVFDDIPQPDQRLCNSFIACYARLSLNRQALDMFVMMHRRCLRIDSYTISPVMKPCSALMAVEIGKQIHSLVIHYGLEWNLFVQTALMGFYAKSGDSLSARKLFDEMTVRATVSWNSIISCYARTGDLDEAMRMFERMLAENHPPNEFIMSTLLSASAKSGNLEMGMKIKALIDDNHWFSNMIVASALIEMFVKCEEVDQARRVFDEMKNKDIVTWGTMISGYAQNSRPNEALHLFQEMKRNRIKPNEIIIVSVLSACAQLGSLNAGEALENYIETSGFNYDAHIASALINMYSSCGQIHKAWQIFHKTMEKNIVIWTSMITGLAFNGFATEAISLFEDLIRSDVKPNAVTFTALLSACVHAGFVDLGLGFFESMRSTYKLAPKIEHYSCIVDLLCRCGRLNEAYGFIRRMEIDSIEPDAVIWVTLLSACRTHPNAGLAEVAVDRLKVLRPENSGNYVLLSNMYASSGRWEDALEMRRVMKKKRVRKTAAYSWIEMEDGIHMFLVSDASHPRSDEIYGVVDALAIHSILEKIDVVL